MIKTKGELEDWLVFDSRSLCVAMAPDCRGPVALVHKWSRRWWIHPETSDITAGTSEERGNKGSDGWVLWVKYIPHRFFFNCSIFLVHTWGAPDSCGPGWGEGCRWGLAPGASEEVSLAGSPQSARCSSSRHTEVVTKSQLTLTVNCEVTTIQLQVHSRWILTDGRMQLPKLIPQDTWLWQQLILLSVCACETLTLISGSWRTSGNALMQLEWAESVCRRWQLRMVVGTALSLLPLRSSSSSCSSRASLLQEAETRLHQRAATANFIFGDLLNSLLLWPQPDSEGRHSFRLMTTFHWLRGLMKIK